MSGIVIAMSVQNVPGLVHPFCTITFLQVKGKAVKNVTRSVLRSGIE